jgi:two-component system sensor histidine kinase CpxA
MALAFDRMAERIQGLIYAQQEMLGHVSHELRSPLTRIGVSLELLRRGESDSLNQMEADLDRMNQLIGKILEITRIDIRTHQQDVIASFETVELSTMLQEIAQDASFETQRIQHKRLLFEPDQSCMVSGDRELLRSACENVVRNALLYTPDDTAIYIRLSRDLSGDTAAIVVRDEGPGVPEDSVAHLFDPFYRVDHAQIAHPEGTGLGLAIAQRIVAMHGGKISARNIQPQGLEVSIVLPLASHK